MNVIGLSVQNILILLMITFLFSVQDAHTLDYSELQLGATNITTFQLIDTQRHYVQSTVQDWVFFHKTLLGDNLQLTADNLKVIGRPVSVAFTFLLLLLLL